MFDWVFMSENYLIRCLQGMGVYLGVDRSGECI